MGDNYDPKEAKKLQDVYMKFQMTVFAGTRSIAICSISKDGEVEEKKERFRTAPGRILRIEDDTKYSCGMLLLMDRMDTKTEEEFYVEKQGCRLF